MNLVSKTHAPFQYVPTLNRMGYMSPSLDTIQKAFVDACDEKGLFLDIGCGFGVATIPAVRKGCHVIACDLEQKHLNVLKQNIPVEKRILLTLIEGHFPNEVTFPENSFEAINMSMVLHFFSFSILERALREIFFCLKEGGRLYLTTSSPYQRSLIHFAPLYEQKRNIEEWPGYIPDISKYVPQRAHLLPKENIVFCIHELKRLVTKFGFHIVDSTFFTREEIPQDLRLDGREYSGIVCEKPRKVSSDFLAKKREVSPTQAANIR